MAYEDAVQELYQVSVAQFVAERKRLADALKAAGDAKGAKQLLARHRPTISAWVVNQLYWHARELFDELLATAEQLRNGELAASGAHRDAIAKLRKRAQVLLEDSGHSATEATLRRVTTTLSALAAAGSFEPDPPGALAADRDPPGFEAVGIPVEPVEAPSPKVRNEHAAHDAEAAARRADEIAESRREEEARKRLAAERSGPEAGPLGSVTRGRQRLESALRTARGDLDARERAVKALENKLEDAAKDVEHAREIVDDLERKLGELEV